MGPLEATKPWNTTGVDGIYRFLNRVWRLFVDENGQLNAKISGDETWAAMRSSVLGTVRSRKLRRITRHLRFNTAISQMMIFVNEAYKTERVAA